LRIIHRQDAKAQSKICAYPRSFASHYRKEKRLDKIAIISDIHGNIPALETVLADIAQRGIETIYCLGDLVGKGPQSALAVDMCRQRCTAVVRGNWDEMITEKRDEAVLQWHQAQLGPERLVYLRHLPNAFDFRMSGRQIRLFHASQTGIYNRVFEDAPYETHLAMFENTPFTGYGRTPNGRTPPDVVGYGDIHATFARTLYRHQKTLFNSGSVGNPLDEPTAAYAILEGHLHSPTPAPFAVQIVRLPYDIERAITLAAEMEMPELEPYKMELRTAVYRGRQ
jgi:protein phosphatase